MRQYWPLHKTKNKQKNTGNIIQERSFTVFDEQTHTYTHTLTLANACTKYMTEVYICTIDHAIINALSHTHIQHTLIDTSDNIYFIDTCTC